MVYAPADVVKLYIDIPMNASVMCLNQAVGVQTAIINQQDHILIQLQWLGSSFKVLKSIFNPQ